MAQPSHHSPGAPIPPRYPPLTAHLEAPRTQQSTLLKVKTKPSPLKNNCCGNCSIHRHLECSCRKVEISHCRKFLEGSRCPEAQPLLRPEKTKAMQASLLQKGSHSLQEEAGSQGGRVQVTMGAELYRQQWRVCRSHGLFTLHD